MKKLSTTRQRISYLVKCLNEADQSALCKRLPDTFPSRNWRLPAENNGTLKIIQESHQL
jgi:hypothetical protein